MTRPTPRRRRRSDCTLAARFVDRKRNRHSLAYEPSEFGRYVALDEKREKIPYIRVTMSDGKVREEPR